MNHTFRSRRDRSFVAFGLSFMVACSGLLSATAPAGAQTIKQPTLTPAQIKMARLQAAKKTSMDAPHVPNQLLVMVHSGADSDEVNNALKDADGTIVRTITNGKLTCYVIQVPNGKMNDSMGKLSKDKEHFDAVQTNVLSHGSRKGGGSFGASNDPLAPQQYQLGLLNIPTGWHEGGNGRGVTIGILDTGVGGNEADLYGRVLPGLNEVTGGHGNVDTGSGGFFHGTFCMTCAAATTNNGTLGASAAMNSLINPVNIFNGAVFTTDADVMAGLFFLEHQHVKLVNLSVNADPPFSFSNPAVHPALFAAFADFFTNHNGLVFNAAGNSGLFCADPQTPFLIVCSAVDSTSTLAFFSNFGTSLWFTGPGVDVPSGYTDNTSLVASGTSFATPLCLSIASQVWAQNPHFTNAQVLARMTATANTNEFLYSPIFYGFGMPDSGAALAH